MRLICMWSVALLMGTAAPGDDSPSGFSRAFESMIPRVVKLYGLRVGMQEGYGSGVIVSADGLVVTVYSLLIEARHVRAVTADGRRWDAEVVARDRDRQLALLRLKRHDDDHLASRNSGRPKGEAGYSQDGAFPYFDLSRKVSLHPGEWVLAAGNAFKVAQGAEPVSLTHGVFSARARLDARRRIRDFPYQGDVLVIDAITSNPGASGGAVVNLDGDFVGMIGRAVISNYTHTHFNYAIPRDVLLEFVREASAERGTAEHPLTSTFSAKRFLSQKKHAAPDVGIRISKVGYRQVLPFVERVTRGSPAARAGVRRDDLILSINGRTVPDIDAYQKQMERVGSKEAISLVIRRGRTIVSVRIEPEEP